MVEELNVWCLCVHVCVCVMMCHSPPLLPLVKAINLSVSQRMFTLLLEFQRMMVFAAVLNQSHFGDIFARSHQINTKQAGWKQKNRSWQDNGERAMELYRADAFSFTRPLSRNTSCSRCSLDAFGVHPGAIHTESTQIALCDYKVTDFKVFILKGPLHLKLGSILTDGSVRA